MVEERLAARGICVPYETVRQGGNKFGRTFSDPIRQRAPARRQMASGMKSSSRIAGEHTGCGARSTSDGFVLDVLVQRQRDRFAAQRLMTTLPQAAVTPPRVMITDKLRILWGREWQMGLRVDHRQHQGLNNRAENSRQPMRRRDGGGEAASSHARQAQRFLSVPIKSRTSFTSLSQNPPRLQPAALRVTAALQSGAKLSAQAPSPDAHLDQNSSPLARGSVNLTVPPDLRAIVAATTLQSRARESLLASMARRQASA